MSIEHAPAIESSAKYFLKDLDPKNATDQQLLEALIAMDGAKIIIDTSYNYVAEEYRRRT